MQSQQHTHAWGRAHPHAHPPTALVRESILPVCSDTRLAACLPAHDTAGGLCYAIALVHALVLSTANTLTPRCDSMLCSVAAGTSNAGPFVTREPALGRALPPALVLHSLDSPLLRSHCCAVLPHPLITRLTSHPRASLTPLPQRTGRQPCPPQLPRRWTSRGRRGESSQVTTGGNGLG